MMRRARLGMLLFIASEAFFFLTLVMSYIYLSVHFGGVPRRYLAVPRTALFSVLLFASSFTAHRAGHAASTGETTRFRAWLAATIALGVAFLAGQGTEYRDLLQAGLTPSSNIFGSAFFTVTGFHGLHVLVGLILLSVLALVADRDHPRQSAVTCITAYWHFVDAVWVVVFGVVYLWMAP